MITSSFVKIKYHIAILILIGFCILSGCQSGKVLPDDIRAPASNGESSHESLSGSKHNAACTVCHENVSKQEIAEHKAYVCSDGHCIDQGCVAEQVKSIANVKSLETLGLPCGGRVEGKDQYCGEACKEKISLTIIRKILKPEERADLDIRLAKANSHTESDGPRTELQRVTQAVEDAFNLCCPKEGCGYVLDKIEGCNAAICENEACKSTFVTFV